MSTFYLCADGLVQSTETIERSICTLATGTCTNTFVADYICTIVFSMNRKTNTAFHYIQKQSKDLLCTAASTWLK